MRGVITTVVSLAAIIAIALNTTIAYAGWCWSDPVVGFKAPGMKEADVSIDVGVPDEYQDKLHDVEIVIVHPINVVPRVKFMDGLLPEQVRFVPSPIPWLGGKVPITVAVSGVGLAGQQILGLGGLSLGAPLPFPINFRITHTLANGSTVVRESSGVSVVPVVDSFMLHVGK